MDINQKREVILENIWNSYDFEGHIISAFNGWERHSPDEYSRVFFLENVPSVRAVFNVKFQKGSVEVENLGWE